MEKQYFVSPWFSMERNSNTALSKIRSAKNLLTIWALSLTLTANNPKVFSQKTITQEEILNTVEGDNDGEIMHNEQEKMYFINNFAHILNYVKDTSDLPFKPRYKNPEIAKKHNFPNKIDIAPKIIAPSKEKDNISDICITLWDKEFKIVPFIGVKVLHWKFEANKTLDDVKMTLVLSNAIGPNVIHMSCKEFAEYAYDFTQIPKWGKKIFFWFTVREVSQKDPTSQKKLLTQNTPNK